MSDGGAPKTLWGPGKLPPFPPSRRACLLRQLHWLPVTQRIDYKILTTVYSVRQRRQPKYLLDLLTNCAPVRILRSSNAKLLIAPPPPMSSLLLLLAHSRPLPQNCGTIYRRL